MDEVLILSSDEDAAVTDEILVSSSDEATNHGSCILIYSRQLLICSSYLQLPLHRRNTIHSLKRDLIILNFILIQKESVDCYGATVVLAPNLFLSCILPVCPPEI